MSRVLPSCDSNDIPIGTRMMIGKDKSYRRVVRRSVIPPILQFTPRIFTLPRVPFYELNLQTMNPPGWLLNQSPAHSFATQLTAGFRPGQSNSIFRQCAIVFFLL